MCAPFLGTPVRGWSQECQPSLWFQQSITSAGNYSSLNLIATLQFGPLLGFEETHSVWLRAFRGWVGVGCLMCWSRTLALWSYFWLSPNTNPSKPTLSCHHSPPSELGRNPTPHTLVMFWILPIPNSENVLLDYSGCHGYRSHFPPDLSFGVTCFLCVWSARELFRNSSTGCHEEIRH